MTENGNLDAETIKIHPDLPKLLPNTLGNLERVATNLESDDARLLVTRVARLKVHAIMNEVGLTSEWRILHMKNLHVALVLGLAVGTTVLDLFDVISRTLDSVGALPNERGHFASTETVTETGDIVKIHALYTSPLLTFLSKYSNGV